MGTTYDYPINAVVTNFTVDGHANAVVGDPTTATSDFDSSTYAKVWSYRNSVDEGESFIYLTLPQSTFGAGATLTDFQVSLGLRLTDELGGGAPSAGLTVTLEPTTGQMAVNMVVPTGIAKDGSFQWVTCTVAAADVPTAQSILATPQPRLRVSRPVPGGLQYPAYWGATIEDAYYAKTVLVDPGPMPVALEADYALPGTKVYFTYHSHYIGWMNLATQQVKYVGMQNPEMFARFGRTFPNDGGTFKGFGGLTMLPNGRLHVRLDWGDSGDPRPWAFTIDPDLDFNTIEVWTSNYPTSGVWPSGWVDSDFGGGVVTDTTSVYMEYHDFHGPTGPWYSLTRYDLTGNILEELGWDNSTPSQNLETYRPSVSGYAVLDGWFYRTHGDSAGLSRVNLATGVMEFAYPTRTGSPWVNTFIGFHGGSMITTMRDQYNVHGAGNQAFYLELFDPANVNWRPQEIPSGGFNVVPADNIGTPTLVKRLGMAVELDTGVYYLNSAQYSNWMVLNGDKLYYMASRRSMPFDWGFENDEGWGYGSAQWLLSYDLVLNADSLEMRVPFTSLDIYGTPITGAGANYDADTGENREWYGFQFATSVVEPPVVVDTAITGVYVGSDRHFG